mmetsp:Transcript_24291/g.23905  ORF Transcript_24291/g.23905 Transcript_24291/m.23905 type:complete len:81 (-) Transcript_24291:490-732(-)
MQKKENAKIKEEIDFYERVIEEKEEEEDLDMDRIDTASHAQGLHQNQSKFSEIKPTIGRDSSSRKIPNRSQINTRGTNRS